MKCDMGTLERLDAYISWESKLELACEAKGWCSERVVRVHECCGHCELCGGVGVRRGQIERIMREEGYEPWMATFG